ncbi:MAG: DMT family transporter [Bacteroidota bacterium]|nr:DMT family transporter [Bacteroidota bacterium]
MPNVSTKSYINLHFLVFIWGFTGVLGELITVGSAEKTWYRMGIAWVLVGCYIWYRKISIKIAQQQIVYLLLTGCIIALHWVAFFEAIEVANVSVTLVTLSTGAFFAAVLEPIFYRRRIIVYELLFGLFVIAGIYLIYEVNGDFLYGIVLTLIAAFLSALFSVINGRLAGKASSSVITLYQLLGGFTLITGYMMFTGKLQAELFQLSKQDWLWIFVLGSICTAYTFVKSIDVMKHISPYTVMLTINLEPIYGIILAVMLFPETEKMHYNFYIGAFIIVATVFVNGVLKLRKSRK